MGPATASENNASVYPAGVETVMPGATPRPGEWLLCVFTAAYRANSLMDSTGRSVVPRFHLGASIVGAKLDYNWGVKLLGGHLVSAVAVPVVSQTVTTPAGTARKTGLSNVEIRAASVAYAKGAWMWWYGLDVLTPGLPYSSDSALNVGQHNWAIAPAWAFSWLPDRGRTEVGSRFNYIVNYTNPDTKYRSGQEFTWEFVAMRSITGKVAVGGNGFYVQQTTDDLRNHVRVADGLRGRGVALGPQVRIHLGRTVLIAKYLRETAAQNRPAGSMFRLQWGVPLGRRD